jgi:hypothetical protein
MSRQSTSVLFAKSGSDAFCAKLVAARDSSGIEHLDWPEGEVGRLGEDVN